MGRPINHISLIGHPLYIYLLLDNFCKTKINQNQTASFIKHQIVLK